MYIRLAYLKRSEDGEVLWEGVELVDKLDVDLLPRVGEHVFLADHLWKDALPHIKMHTGARRFVVVRVEHKWDRLMAPIYDVHVADLLTPAQEKDHAQV